MADSVSSRMHEDWNAHAREGAGYYVASAGAIKEDAEVFATSALAGRELTQMPLENAQAADDRHRRRSP